MGVNLCGGDICVSKHFLHASEIRPVGEQLSCEAVSEGVRADFPSHLAAHRVLADHAVNVFPEHCLTRAGNEEIYDAFLGFSLGQVVFEGAQGLGGNWHYSFFRAFSNHPKDANVKVDVSELERRKFRRSEAARIEQRHHGLIANGMTVNVLRGLVHKPSCPGIIQYRW